MYKSIFPYNYNILRNFRDDASEKWTNKSVRSRPKTKDRFRRVSRQGCTGSRSPRKLATRNSLARQTGRSRQTRSARVRETFRLCPGGEQSTSCSLSEAFFSSRLDGRVGRAFMLLSSLVATQAPPPEDRQFLSRDRVRKISVLS